MGTFIGIMGILITIAAAAYFPLADQKDWWPFSSGPPSALVNVEILLDRSSAMGETFEGTTKLEAAISAAETVLNSVGTKDNLALRQFGGPCQGDNTEQLIPFDRDNRDEVQRALADIVRQQPSRETRTLWDGGPG